MHRPSRSCAACCLVFISLLLAACSPSKPETTVETFYQAAARKDMDKAIEQIALNDVPANEMLMAKGMLQMMIGMIATGIEGNDGLKQIEILESTLDEDGHSASVRSKLIYNNGEDETTTNHLRREGSKWKITPQ